MESIQSLFFGFGVALSPQNIFAAGIGAILGLVVGALPGMGAVTGVALLLPLTFSFNPTTAVIMLAAIYYANMYGGSYSAIVLNIPGDSSAVMTTLDGYPLARSGKAGKALFTANMASFIGGTIGMIILTFTGPLLAQFGLKFGPVEMTSLLLVAMTSLGWIMGENPMKGLMSTALGMTIATMGMDIITGEGRFSFGILSLLSGVPFIPLVIGAFGFSQVLMMMAMRSVSYESSDEKISLRDSFLTKGEIKRTIPPILRSGVLGTIVGILPGAGGTIANFFGYILETKVGKNTEMMGKGAVEGVAASEAANNSAVSGSLAPLLSLGIPGSGTTAVLLGGLVMWGLTPGPMLFKEHPDFVWGLIASLYVANIITLAMGLAFIPFVMKITKVPMRILIPLVTVVCFVGSYSSTNSLYGVIVMLAASLIGFVLSYNKYPTAPFLLAFVLAPTLEYNMRESLVLSFGSINIFFQKPISLFFVCVLVITMLLPAIKFFGKKTKIRIRKENEK